MRFNLKQQLQSGINEMDIELSEAQQKNLVDLLNLVLKWNKTYNLTAITEPEDMLRLHLLDSLSLLPSIRALLKQSSFTDPIIDVGTGAGFPGMVLALADSRIQITLLDSSSKRCRFLNHVRMHFKLANVTVVDSRVEQHQSEQGYRLILSRAFASIKDMADNSGHLLQKNGHFLAMKGRVQETEITQLASMYSEIQIKKLTVPGLEAERTLVDISNQPKRAFTWPTF